MPADAIRIKDLRMTFEDTKAVDGISFTVKEGELFGLLGPNGAGKTTTINMLSTLLRPTSGYAEVSGIDVTKDRDGVRKSIGVVFQDTALDGRLTARENLEFHAAMYGMSRTTAAPKIDEVLALVELEEKGDVLVEKYSGGMKRRLEIARGLIHHPRVLFLDEPTLGLDAQTRRRIWDYIRRLNREAKVTIILTTHYMEEADFLCDRVAIIDNGKIATIDSPRNLKDMLGGDVVYLGLGGNGGRKEFAAHLKGLKWVRRMRREDGKLALVVKNGERRIPTLIDMARERGLRVDSVSLHKPSLEDVFLHFTGRSIRDEEGAGRSWILRGGPRGGGPHGRGGGGGRR